MNQEDSSQRLDVLTKRLGVLRRLCEGPAHKRDLVEELGQSRSTIDRSVRELEELNFVEHEAEGIRATVAGRLAVEHLVDFQDDLDDIVTAEAVVNPLPLGVSLDTEVVAGSEAMLATEPVPYRPLEGVHDALTEADRYRTVLPTLDDPRHVRLLYEHVVTENNPAELVVTSSLLETLRAEFPRRLAAMAEQDGFKLLVAEELPPFALCLADAAETTVSVIVFADSGTVHGVLRNDAADAVAWARERYEAVRADATERTDALVAGGDEGADTDGGLAVMGESLSVALERQGFVRLDVSYFRDEPVADPRTAWRAGLSLAEVHTGYAVGRSVDDDGQGLGEQVQAELHAGSDCLLVGPPGAGKSTLCKRVACAWYEDDVGPVLYREQGRGRPIESVEDIVVTADAAAGHTLIVVEDAVRPETSAIFEAIDRLAGRDDVSFLLDSRESEWLDPPAGLDLDVEVQVRTVPELDDQDCERLIEHFEHTVGESVDVPADQLWEEVREEIADKQTGVSGMLLLLHRLSTYADPLSDGQTPLEEAVTALDDELDDELDRKVCLLANALNAAGLGVDRDALYAVADPAAFEAVDDAIQRLDGELLFSRPDGNYRTVHESWSVTFLASVLQRNGESAAETFGEAVTALLSLADESGRRDQIRAHVDEPRTVAAIEASPNDWVAKTVEALYALGRDRPKLARLFGDGTTDTVALPEATPADPRAQRPVWLGRMFLAAGDGEAAERAFERLSRERTDAAVERLLGLARVAAETGRYDAAIDQAEECLSLIDDDRPLAESRAHLVVGRVLTNRGDYGDASSRLGRALEGFETVGDERRAGTALDLLGRAARDQGAYGDAREFLERSLDISRRLGDRKGAASSHIALGTAMFGLGEYERAREHFERSLDIVRERGNRYREFDNLKWLGTVALYRSEYDRAEKYYERALEVARRVEDPRREGEILGSIGLLAERVGEYDRAREELQRGLDIAEEIGNSRNVAARRNNLGLVAVRRAAYDRAREQFEAGLSTAREHGNRRHEANALNGLAHVALMRGRYDQAREHSEEALAITRDIENRRRIADSYNKLGRIAFGLDEHDCARKHFEKAQTLARSLDHPREAAKALTGLGELARLDEDYEQASEQIDAALERIEPTGAGIETSHVRLSGARLACDRGDHDEARELGERVRDYYEEIGAVQWAGRAETLLGRVAVERGDDETAREHWESALERFAATDAPQDELATLELLVEHADDADAWRERLDECVADAPEVVVEQHDWVEEALPEEGLD